MAKYIKSIFTPEKRLNSYEDEDETGPQMDERRKLSMSRSGRLKQSYKRRQQLNVDVYGGEDLHAAERPKTLEYHVNKPVTPTPTTKETKIDSQTIESKTSTGKKDLESSNGNRSPDEEIDNAFDIIDKS